MLKARGESEAVVLRAEADAKAQAARARGQAEAITTVFRAIHEGNPDQRLLAYQYMQMLPQIAQGDANKVWIVPSEIGKALEGIGGLVSAIGGQSAAPSAPSVPSVPSGTPVPPQPQLPQPEPAAPPALAANSGTGPQFDAPVGRHAGLEGWLAGSGGTVHDGPVGDGEGGAVPRAGDAGSAPFDDDPSLV